MGYPGAPRRFRFFPEARKKNYFITPVYILNYLQGWRQGTVATVPHGVIIPRIITHLRQMMNGQFRVNGMISKVESRTIHETTARTKENAFDEL